jgi:hypothetical protein
MREMRMSRLPLWLAATLILALGVLSAPRQVSAEPVGFVAATVGSVDIQAAGTTSWAAALVDRDIELGDTVRTGPASAIKMLLADETILALGESTELVIDAYIVGAAATRDPSILKLLKGRARVLVGEAFGGPTRVEMHTPTAVIGVKGTEFEAYVIEDPVTGMWTLVCNLGGSIFVRQLEGAARRTVTPRYQLCTRVFRDQPPEDEIRRPVGFPPVPMPSTQPAPILGAQGVAGGGTGSGGNLHRYVVSDDTGLMVKALIEELDLDLREDPDPKEDKRNPEPPRPPSAPPPIPLPPGSTPQAPPD